MKQKAIPLCHPNSPHKAKGLCFSCYDKVQYHKNPKRKSERHNEWAQNNTEHLKTYRAKRKQQNPLQYVLHSIKKRAKEKGFEFNLTIQDLRDIWTEICPVFGVKMEFHTPNKQNNSYSVDRIDSMKEYTKDNICIISWRANRLKCDASLEELKNLVRYMSSKL